MLLTSMLRVLLTRSFKPFVFEGKYQNELDFMDLENLGLYVHIPFCRTLCSFCPYCKEVYDQEKADRYKRALLKEIEIVGSGMKKRKPVTSLYFGGGTPALMVDDLGDVIKKLKVYFDIEGGIGLELHPQDVNPDVLGKLKAYGVTMVSIGIQSFDQTCLAKIGRSYDGFQEKIKLAKDFGFEVIDVDLIFAIPGQTDKSLQADIDKAFNCGATQVSTYPFIDFTFSSNEYKPMSEAVKKRMLNHLSDYCEEIGLERTSVWTFGKRGTDKYSSVTRDSFLGFGLSATTLLRDSFKINTFSLEDYINRVSQNSLPTSLTIDFTKRQRAVYYLFWRAYTLDIDSRDFEDLIGVPIMKMFGHEIRLAKWAGLLEKRYTTYRLTNKAMVLYHSIEQVYTNAYIDKMWHISRKQAFPERIVLK